MSSSDDPDQNLGQNQIPTTQAQRGAHVALDIPGAANRTPWQQSPASLGVSESPDNYFPSGSLGVSGASAGLFGSLSGAQFNYGTSPGGYGLGHLMRRRNSHPSGSLQSLTRLQSFREEAPNQGQPTDTTTQGAQPLDSSNNTITNTNSNTVDALPYRKSTEYFGYQIKPAMSPSTAAAVDDLTLPLLHQTQHGFEDSATAAAASGGGECVGTIASTTLQGNNSTAAQIDGQNRTRALIFGILNAVAGIPALIAYAAIVFKHPSYAEYVDPLCKLFFLSSAVHQAVFCVMSTLPFAVGQVQDVGIIFLSSMASSIAVLATDAGHDTATALGTSLLAMTISTFLVGAATLVVARRSWSYFVSFVPLPVMGGYLSFVGYFCIASGVGLGTSLDISGPLTWLAIFHRLPLLKLVPTVASCAAIMLTLEKAQHPLALPSVLIALIGIFHVVLFAAGISLPQARDAGWVMPPAAEGVQFWEVFKLYNLQNGLSGIAWPALWVQAGKAMGLTALVIFGSAMDIMAIQADVQGKIDIDRELTTVAVSNMATGALAVGFPGSYIFSQTLVTMRAGVFNRLNGWTIVAAELLAFVLPYSIVSIVPNYFLGGLLLWFGVEIARDWLILSFFKLTHVEYCLLLVTFFSVIQFGLEGGILAGVLAATVYFAYAYSASQMRSFSLGMGRLRSTVVRSVDQQAALSVLWHARTAAAKVQGFVFFGTAHSISSKLQEAAANLAAAPATHHDGSLRFVSGEGLGASKLPQAIAAIAAAPRFIIIDWSKATGCDASGARSVATALKEISSLGVTPVLTAAHHHGIDAMLEAHDVRLRRMHWPPDLLRPPPASPLDAYAEAPITFGEGGLGDDGVLPFMSSSRRRGNGSSNRTSLDQAHRPGVIDQQHIASPFVSNVVAAAQQQHEATITPTAAATLVEDSSNIPIDADTVLIFGTLEEGLRFCEDVLLRTAVRFGVCDPPTDGISLEELLRSHIEALPLMPGQPSAAAATAAAAELRECMHQQLLRKGESLWNVGDPADELYIIEKGVLRVDELQQDNSNVVDRRSSVPRDLGGRRLVRSFELGPGCVAGSTDFFLGRPHGTRALCSSDSARVLRLGMHGMQRAAVEAPAALNLLQLAVMRANSVDLLAAAETAIEM